jgi:hypothetical protein
MKTYIPKFRTFDSLRSTAILAVLAGLTISTQAQLLYRWDFDAPVTGTTVTPSVAVGGGGGLSMSYNGVATDLYGAPGSGVSGTAGDRSFANNNTTYGNASVSGLAASTAGNINIGVQTKFTMTGWMKADGGYAGQADNTFQRVFMIGQGTPDTGAANAATLALFNNSGAGQRDSLQLRLSNINGPDGSNGALTGNGTLLPFGSDWTFFAVTVDLTAIANNVNVYLGGAGSLNSPITLSYNNAGVAIGSIDFGTTASALFLNRANGQRGFDGWGDDFRFYSGELDQSAVEAIRAQVVPEPTAATLLGLGFIASFMTFRRGRNN